ncbi:MAG: peptidase S8 [Candidatus Cybelea sp.]
MKSLDFGRYALSSCVAAAMLAGCGGSQPPIGAPGLTQSDALQLHAPIHACNGSRLARAQCDALIESSSVHADTPTGWSPADLQSAYNLPSSTRGKGQIVAIVDAYDNPKVASDLSEYRSTFNLPKAKFTKYNQEGQTGNYPAKNKSWGLEIDNDVEMVSASCPKCTIYLIEANSDSWSDIETAQAEAVTLGAHIVSNSFSGEGANESYWDTPGVEYVASSGSAGLYDPATFVHVVAVGGTMLTKGGGESRGWTESVLSESGGGCSSTDEQKPPWQHDRYTKSCAYRVGNDVSAVAEGVAMYDSYGSYGGWLTISGTSVGTPLLSGVFGLAGNATKQDGGETFWETSHHQYLYEVEYKGKERRFSYPAGWGTPDGIKAF